MTGERYEIRVKGRLTPSLQAAFDGLTAQVEPVETVLSGTIADQAALYGVLQHVHALGLELVEVRRVAGVVPQGAGDDPADSEQ